MEEGNFSETYMEVYKCKSGGRESTSSQDWAMRCLRTLAKNVRKRGLTFRYVTLGNSEFFGVEHWWIREKNEAFPVLPCIRFWLVKPVFNGSDWVSPNPASRQVWWQPGDDGLVCAWMQSYPYVGYWDGAIPTEGVDCSSCIVDMGDLDYTRPKLSYGDALRHISLIFSKTGVKGLRYTYSTMDVLDFGDCKEVPVIRLWRYVPTYMVGLKSWHHYGERFILAGINVGAIVDIDKSSLDPKRLCRDYRIKASEL